MKIRFYKAYRVRLTRIVFEEAFIEVSARNKEEAEEIAERAAGDIEPKKWKAIDTADYTAEVEE